MSAPSLFALHKSGDSRVSSRKGHKVDIDRIVLDPKFNIRKIDNDHVGKFKRQYLEGKPVPKIWVFLNDDGGIQVLEGHHRLVAMRDILEEGPKLQKEYMEVQTLSEKDNDQKKFLERWSVKTLEEAFDLNKRYKALEKEFEKLPVEFFKGDESERVLFMMRSSEGLQLTPTQRADTYLRLEKLGKSQKEIAELDGVTVARVSQLLKIAKMDDEVKTAIDENKISATKVTKIISGVKDNSEACQKVKDVLNNHGSKGKVTDGKTNPYKNNYGKFLFEILARNFELGLCSSEEVESEEEQSDEEEGKKLQIQFLAHRQDWQAVIKDINAYLEDKKSISEAEANE